MIPCSECVIDWCLFGTVFFKALLGAILTGLAAFFGAWIGLFKFQKSKARYIGRKIDLIPSENHGTWTNLRVHNQSEFSMRDTYVYVSVRHTPKDIEKPPPTRERPQANINRDKLVQVYEDRICWTLQEDHKNKFVMDVHPHERQNATFIRFGDDTNYLIGIASENATQNYRVFLNPKPEGKEAYRVLIKVVSADAYQAAWEAKIDLDDPKFRVKLVSNQLSVGEYERRLGKYQEYYNSH
jgi:hypothetical protein